MISNTDSDIRWKQRFSNLKKAFDGLSQALAIDNPDIVQRAGIIQFFEMSFELSWKTIKDYLEYNGFEEQNSPRTVLKTAFQANIIIDGHNWIKCLESRNLMSNIYDEETSNLVEANIRNIYYFLLKDLVTFFEKNM